MYKLLVFLAAAASVARAQPFGFEFRPEYKRTSLGDSIDQATMKLLKASYEVADDKNVVSSPLGLMLLLSLYSGGANEPTKDEINQFLAGPDYKKQLTDSAYPAMSQQFSRMNPEYLTLANKVYVSDQFTPTDQFKLSANTYQSDIETLDFKKPQDAATVVNEWASEKTKGNIKEPVNADTFEPDTAAALFNVIYFTGQWHVPFNATETKEKDFHVDKKTTVKKPMMHLLQSLYYTESEELGAKIIELPYKERGFRMVVVLPNELAGLPSVMEKAAEKGLLTDVFNLHPAGRDILLDMPKFEARSKLDFNKILPEVGVSKIFNEPAPGIVKERPVKLSKVFQEAFIKVNEEGATAGAFTGAVAVTTSSNSTPPPPLKFTVDHPFLYSILYEDKVLFAGIYNH